VERGKCSDRGLMFLTGPVCFLCNACDEIKDPTHAVKVKVVVLNQQDKSWKICGRSSHVLTFINMGTILASTWTEWGKSLKKTSVGSLD